MLKANDKNDESSKLIGESAREEKILKFTAKCCNTCSAKGIELIQKGHLMSHDSKTNNLMQIFTYETNVQHTLNQKKSNDYQNNYLQCIFLKKMMC